MPPCDATTIGEGLGITDGEALGEGSASPGLGDGLTAATALGLEAGLGVPEGASGVEAGGAGFDWHAAARRSNARAQTPCRRADIDLGRDSNQRAIQVRTRRGR